MKNEPSAHIASRLCVFLAEDDAPFRALVAQVLRADGHLVVEASDGMTLMTNIARLGLQRGGGGNTLVVCDVRMPICDGLTVLRNMREHGNGQMPFAFMTAFPDDELYEEARRLGARQVLAKPFQLSELVALAREVAHIAVSPVTNTT